MTKEQNVIDDLAEYSIFDDLTYPDEVYIIEYSNKTHAIGVYNGIHGLACFTTENQALFFHERVNLNENVNFSIIKVQFDEAREIAKSKSGQICSLLVFSDLNTPPQVHYVK